MRLAFGGDNKTQSLSAAMPEDDSNREVRLTHARELLGKYYKKSIVRKGVNSDHVSEFISQHIRSALKGKWKSKAARISRTILQESEKYEFDPMFVMAVIENESSFIPGIVGKDGEIGLMQLRPKTAEWVANKFKLPWKGEKTLRDPIMNIRIGTAYLSLLRERFDAHSRLYLSAYNMGAGNVKKALSKQVWPKDYPVRVMKRYVHMYSKLLQSESQIN